MAKENDEEIHSMVGNKIRKFCKDKDISHLDMIMLFASCHEVFVGFCNEKKFIPEDVVELYFDAYHKGKQDDERTNQIMTSFFICNDLVSKIKFYCKNRGDDED